MVSSDAPNVAEIPAAIRLPDQRLARDEQRDEERHVQGEDPDRPTTGPEFEARGAPPPPPAARPRPRGGLQARVASRIASEARERAKENSRTLVRSVARLVRKQISAAMRQQRGRQLVDDEQALAEEEQPGDPSGRGPTWRAAGRSPARPRSSRPEPARRRPGSTGGPQSGFRRVGHPGRTDRRDQDAQLQPGQVQLEHHDSSPIGADGGNPVRFPGTGAGQQVGPAPLHAVAPAKGSQEGADDEPVDRRVEAGRARSPTGRSRVGGPSGQPAIGQALSRRQVAADGVLQLVVVVQQRRGPEQLEGPQAGVADDVDQRDVPQPEADLGRDDPDLGQRGEGQSRLGVGLHPARDRREDRRGQADRHDDRAEHGERSRIGLTRSSRNAPRWTDNAP